MQTHVILLACIKMQPFSRARKLQPVTCPIKYVIHVRRGIISANVTRSKTRQRQARENFSKRHALENALASSAGKYETEAKRKWMCGKVTATKKLVPFIYLWRVEKVVALICTIKSRCLENEPGTELTRERESSLTCSCFVTFLSALYLSV